VSATYSKDQQQQLLALARAAVRRADDTESGTPLPTLEAALGDQRRAAFVTLTRDSQLRGCIGSLAADRPLRETIAELAIASATEDPRFPPVRADEVSGLRIEISVLSTAADARPEDVVIGTHGVIVERGTRRGLLLPQVATEHHLTRAEFLDAVCVKAGFPADAWREPTTRLQTFTAEVFGEAR